MGGVYAIPHIYGRTRLAYRVAAGLAGACVVASATALLQAYGLVESDYISLSRAPGGTLGNRNFVAHLAATGRAQYVTANLTGASRLLLGDFAPGQLPPDRHSQPLASRVLLDQRLL